MSQRAQRALVTGASSGIGKVYAEHLARLGYNLVITARRKTLLDELATGLVNDWGVEVEVIQADLAQASGVQTVSDRLEKGSFVDLFINNAGYAVRGPVAALDPDALDTMLKVNVLALSRLSHSAMKRMTLEKRGKVINIASATAFIFLPGNAGYGASKTYVLSFTRHMQLEARGTGIYVQALIPGVVATDFHELAGANLENFPPAMVMSAQDLVEASLKAMEMEELVCIPSLPDVKDWLAYEAAEKAVAANVSRDRPAPRYT